MSGCVMWRRLSCKYLIKESHLMVVDGRNKKLLNLLPSMKDLALTIMFAK